LGIKSANDLAKVMAAAGMAQNLGALRALATVGIQAGHMKLHLKNMISAAGAMDHEIDIVANMVKQSGERITMATVEAAILEIRKK
jgi:hydroxymethylglutaryl-CoA reductase